MTSSIRRVALGAAVSIVALGGGPAVAGARGPVDQQTTGSANGAVLSSDGTGQVFTAGRSGALDAVRLSVSVPENVPVTVGIEPVNAYGYPDFDNALGGSTTDVQKTNGFKDTFFDFSRPVQIEKGKQYFIGVATPARARAIEVATGGDRPYAGGSLYEYSDLVEDKHLLFATYVTEPFAEMLASGSGATASGSALAFDVQGPLSAPTGTFSLKQTSRTLSGTIACMSFRTDGKDKYLGKRAVIGIKTDEAKPRYIEYYVQDLPGTTADRIVQTGTAKDHLHTAPPAGCYHAAPASIEQKHALQDGSITLTRPAASTNR